MRGKYASQISRLDPVRECREIVFLLTCFEFPWDIERALEFALFRTGGLRLRVRPILRDTRSRSLEPSANTLKKWKIAVALLEFKIPTRWLVKGSADEVYDLISKPEDFVRWWSDVYLRVEEVEPGDENGIGRVHDLHTRGWLPFTLVWQSRVIEARKPVRLVIEALGDLEGRGEWRFRQDGESVQVAFDWRVIANKPLIRYLVPVLKPMFAANHHWAMQRGLEGLERELGHRGDEQETL
jgi:hypothetical protein